MSQTVNLSAVAKKLADIPEDEMMSKFDDAIEHKMRQTSRSMVDRRMGIMLGFRRKSAPVVSIRALIASTDASNSPRNSPPDEQDSPLTNISLLSSSSSSLSSSLSVSLSPSPLSTFRMEDNNGSSSLAGSLFLELAEGGGNNSPRNMSPDKSPEDIRLNSGGLLKSLQIVEAEDESPRSGPSSLEDDISPNIDLNQAPSFDLWMARNVNQGADQQ